jgi:allantoicase
MTRWDHLPDLASRRLGGGVVAANDELFAAADHLVLDEPPSFSARTFGPKGQVYDGWETRRRREPGHDHAIVRLGAPGIVRGVVVDTSFFTGNYPPYASVEGCCVDGHPSPSELSGWFPLVPRSPLAGDSRNEFVVSDVERRVTHVRLSIYPDGGVARLRVHGEVVPDPRLLPAVIDLAAMEHGGQVVACSNMFYGPPHQLIAPGLARVMGDGWETARRRDDANDWVVVKLAAPGLVRLAELDTSHFKGRRRPHVADFPLAHNLRTFPVRSPSHSSFRVLWGSALRRPGSFRCRRPSVHIGRTILPGFMDFELPRRPSRSMSVAPAALPSASPRPTPPLGPTGPGGSGTALG